MGTGCEGLLQHSRTKHGEALFLSMAEILSGDVTKLDGETCRQIPNQGFAAWYRQGLDERKDYPLNLRTRELRSGAEPPGNG